MKLNAPVVWLTFPGHRFFYGTQDGSVWHHQYVAFAGPRVRAYIRSGLYPIHLRPPVIPIWQADQLHDGLDQLNICLNSTPQNIARATNLLEGILLQLHQQKPPPRHLLPPHVAALRQMAESIEKNPEKELDFRHEANALNMSYAHFRRLFRRVIGQAPRQFVLRHRLDKAAASLQLTGLPIKAVAEQIGIHDVCYFSKLFRQKFHISPGAYRANFNESVTVRAE